MIYGEQKTYRKGQIFLREKNSGNRELYILAITDCIPNELDGVAQMNLINLKSGDRWGTAVGVENCMAITQQELEKLFSTGSFEAVEFEDSSLRVNFTTHHTVLVGV